MLRFSVRTPGRSSAEAVSKRKQNCDIEFLLLILVFLESKPLFDARGGSANESIQSTLHNHGISKVEN